MYPNFFFRYAISPLAYYFLEYIKKSYVAVLLLFKHNKLITFKQEVL